MTDTRWPWRQLAAVWGPCAVAALLIVLLADAVERDAPWVWNLASLALFALEVWGIVDSWRILARTTPHRWWHSGKLILLWAGLVLAYLVVRPVVWGIGLPLLLLPAAGVLLALTWTWFSVHEGKRRERSL